MGDRPNAVWSADFKGWFKLSSGQKCYPLTITDGFSRYLIRCDALEHPDAMALREVFESAFSEFGLPEVLRLDNGTSVLGPSRHQRALGLVGEAGHHAGARRGKATENGPPREDAPDSEGGRDSAASSGFKDTISAAGVRRVPS